MDIKKFDIPQMYVEAVNGTPDWYRGLYFVDDFCDLCDAEEMIKDGKKFKGNKPYIIHYPDGHVYEPLDIEENVFYCNPVWDRGSFGILAVDFNKEEIIIYTYTPGEVVETVHSMPLSEIGDCDELKLEMTPWILARHTCDNYEAIWPIKKTFNIKNTDTLICRNGDVLYFSRWFEDPYYHEQVITVDINSGEEIEIMDGSIYLMPNGTLWNI